MKLKRLLTAASIGLMAFAPMVASAANQFNASQTKDIQQIVHDYIVKNPQVLVEASKALQAQQRKQMVNQAKTAIEQNGKQLFDDKLSPSIGNPKGGVTLVEFFDFQCIHCKQMAPVVSDLVSKDKNLRVIYKQFPIFGKGSEFAAKAALASQKQGKYKAFHKALMASKKRLSSSNVLKIAESVGLNTKQLKKDMQNSAVSDELKANVKLAEKLRLMGTPAFIIANTPDGKFQQGSKSFFVPGAASEQSLQDLISQANG